MKASQWGAIGLLFLFMVPRFLGIGELEFVLSERGDSGIEFTFTLDRT